MSHRKLVLVHLLLFVSAFAKDKLHISVHIDTERNENSDIVVFYIIPNIGTIECIEDCKSRKRCQFVNYIARSSTCFLLGVSGGGSITSATALTRLTYMPGYLFGIKEDWKTGVDDVCETCPDIGPCLPGIHSADETSVSNTCKTSGCDKPYQLNTVVYGTQYNFGKWIKYVCSNGYALKITTTNTAKCQQNGTWSQTDFTCDYDCGTLTIVDGLFTATSGTTERMTATLSCNIGYILWGQTTITCTQSGWDGNATCTAKDCGAPVVTNGRYTASSGTTFGSSARLYCISGYDFSGDSVVTCTTNGWSGSATCTEMDCGTTPVVYNGHFVAASGTSFGMSATLSCDPGHISSGDTVIACTEIGWDGSATCTIVDCGTTPAVDNGHFVAASGTTFGMYATLSCDPGHVSAGDTAINCTEIGWNGTATCTIVDCGTTLAVYNGQFVAASGTTFGMSATLSCDPGHFSSGDTAINCTETGWDGSATCTIIDCGTTPAVYNGHFAAASGTTFGMSATLSCDSGHISSGDTAINCTEIGWDGSATCTLVDCGATPAVDNGHFVAASGTTFGMSATLSCDPGHVSAGDTAINCTELGWDGSATCIIVDCGTTPAVNNGQFVAASGTTFGMFATLSCDPGHVSSGDTAITCTEIGWDGNATCTLTDCGTTPAVDNGHFLAASGTTFGMSAALSCDPGHVIAGDTVINCTEIGWDGSATCTFVDCGNPTPQNGASDSSVYSYGSVIRITCNSGLTLTGSSSIECQADGSWSNSPTCGCASSQHLYSTSCYEVITQAKNWNNAKSYCESISGHLVDVNSQGEQNFVKSLMQANDDSTSYWTGGNDKSRENVFKWSDNSRISNGYTNWHSSQPDNSRGGEDCMDIIPGRPFYYTWNDNVCSYTRLGICEIEF